MGGIEPLLQTFRELEQRGVRGRILTTDYLNFSEPGALDKLAGFSNIEVRMFQSDGTAQGFHTKGYVFRNRELYRILVGSSNMTLSALGANSHRKSFLNLSACGTTGTEPENTGNSSDITESGMRKPAGSEKSRSSRIRSISNRRH